MDKEMQSLHDERMTLLKDTIRMNKTERIPSLCSGGSYTVYDSGYGWGEALHSWEIMKDSLIKFQKKYNFDLLCSTGTRNPLAIAEALGGSNYIINEEQYGLTYVDKHGMEADEYDELIKNPEKFAWEHIVRRFYPNATKEMFAASLAEFMEFGQYAQNIGTVLKEEWDCRFMPKMFLCIRLKLFVIHIEA